MKLLYLLLYMQTQMSVNWCDSISYSVIENSNGVFSVTIETTDSLDNYCDTVDVYWGVCNSDFCFSGIGAFASFPIIQLTDTVKVCYNAYIMNPQGAGTTIIPCTNQCDTVVFNGLEWVQFPITNSVGVNEIPLRPTKKIYNLQGIKLLQEPKNKIYIKNRKLHYEFRD